MTSRKQIIYGILSIITVVGIIAFPGCSKNKATNVSNPPPPPTHLVNITNFSFSPAVDTVAVGDTVTWRNDDSASHTVTSDSGTELQSPSIGQGSTYEHIFTAVGVHPYHCTIHTSMHGVVIVR
jgi:plastocyanin